MVRAALTALAFYALLALIGYVTAQGGGATGLSAITAELSAANTEARSSILPAISAILGVMVLIGVAGGIVAVLTRNK